MRRGWNKGQSPEWPPERAAKARALWDAGLSASAIAQRMGCTKNALLGLAHRRAWPARPSPVIRDAADPRRKPAPVERAGAVTLPPLASLQ